MLVMLPLFSAKVNMTEFIALTAYRNLKLSKDKIQGIFREEEEPEEAPGFAPAGTEIVFENVDFSYVDGEPVLEGASFTIPAGKLTAIVGDSGAGKSTVLNLIAKYYRPQSGRVTIGGQDIRRSRRNRCCLTSVWWTRMCSCSTTPCAATSAMPGRGHGPGGGGRLPSGQLRRLYSVYGAGL